ncbi:unnamed protein product, partial [Rotaria magnacalcarata]
MKNGGDIPEIRRPSLFMAHPLISHISFMFICLFASPKPIHMKLNLSTNHLCSLFSNIKHWMRKIRAEITCEYPKRTFLNTHGTGEISNWDLSDASGFITLVAFNLNSHTMSNKLKKNKAYEFTNLNIRLASDAFKTLPHQFQLLCTNGTNVKEIDFPVDHQH